MITADPQPTTITGKLDSAEAAVARSLVAAALSEDPLLTPFDIEIVREVTASGAMIYIQRRPGLPKKITGV